MKREETDKMDSRSLWYTSAISIWTLYSEYHHQSIGHFFRTSDL